MPSPACGLFVCIQKFRVTAGSPRSAVGDRKTPAADLVFSKRLSVVEDPGCKGTQNRSGHQDREAVKTAIKKMRQDDKGSFSLRLPFIQV